jgi:hypothetical protein
MVTSNHVNVDTEIKFMFQPALVLSRIASYQLEGEECALQKKKEKFPIMQKP